jgi:Ca2+/Na+ antiporter
METLSSLIRCFNFGSIKKFPPDLISIIGAIPTLISFYLVIPLIFQKIDFIGISVILITIIIILYSYYLSKKCNEYEKTVAEVLETGYFWNFFMDLYTHIELKENGNKKINFMYVDSENVEPVPATADQIKVKIILPSSNHSLQKTIEKVNNMTQLCSIDNKIRVRTKKNPDNTITNPDNTITIFEYPQTLQTIKKYFPKKDKYSDYQSKKFYRYFIDKFNTHLEQEHIRSDRFESIDADRFLASMNE